jgi:hypothetical protein
VRSEKGRVNEARLIILTPHPSLLTPHPFLLTPHPSLLTPHSSLLGTPQDEGSVVCTANLISA